MWTGQWKHRNGFLLPEQQRYKYRSVEYLSPASKSDSPESAIQDSVTGTALQLTNLHGDVVATASLSQSATGLTGSLNTTSSAIPSPIIHGIGGE
jgi:hypothetical protein